MNAAPADSTTTLARRLEALDEAATIAEGRLGTDAAHQARSIVDRSRGRLGHGTHHCVIALAGPTGAGKSSLFNALAGADLSTTGVRRPTTSETQACVWGPGAAGLLDWLDVKHRHHVDATAERDGLVLLDLPDFDSTQSEHRDEVDRLVGLVDLFIWVVDPQKYADHALHEGYLRPLAEYSAVMRFLLSKSDTLPAAELDACVADLHRLLDADGITGAAVVAVSTMTGDGFNRVESVIAEAVSARQAVVDRVEADLRSAAGTLRQSHVNGNPNIAKKDRRVLVDQLSSAAGADIAGSLVASQYKRDAGQAMGWPPLRWVSRLRRSPLEDLPTAGSSAVADAEIRSALRDVGEAAGRDIDEPWRSTLRRTAQQQQQPVASRLGAVTLKSARAMRDHPKWWSAVQWLQRTAMAVALVGLIWLVVILVIGGFLRLDADPLTPMIGWMPLPTLLLLAGALVGLIVALAIRIPVAVGAGRRGARARSIIVREIESVADESVIAPLEAAIADRRRLDELLAEVAT